MSKPTVITIPANPYVPLGEQHTPTTGLNRGYIFNMFVHRDWSCTDVTYVIMHDRLELVYAYNSNYHLDSPKAVPKQTNTTAEILIRLSESARGRAYDGVTDVRLHPRGAALLRNYNSEPISPEDVALVKEVRYRLRMKLPAETWML